MAPYLWCLLAMSCTWPYLTLKLCKFGNPVRMDFIGTLEVAVLCTGTSASF